MHTHVLSELGEEPRTNDGISAAALARVSVIGSPEPIMFATTKQGRSDFLQIPPEIWNELLGYPEALRPLCLGVGGVHENIYACIVELERTMDREGIDTAAT